MELFKETEAAAVTAHAPLAVRMRPRTPEEFVGQAHFFGPGKWLECIPALRSSYSARKVRTFLNYTRSPNWNFKSLSRR